MFELTAPQATVIAASLVLLGGLTAYFGRALAFLGKRWWTGAPKQEQAAYFNALADLTAKLKTSGVGVGELHQLETLLRNPNLAESTATAKVLEATAHDADEWDPNFDNNAAMKMRAGAAYEVAEAKLLQAQLDLRLVMGDDDHVSFDAVQGAWATYRDELISFAASEFEGGTHAGLAGVLAGLAETERRTEEILADVKGRRGR